MPTPPTTLLLMLILFSMTPTLHYSITALSYA